MGCACGGKTSANSSDTLGYYVILPNGELYPSGINPENPDAGAAPLFSVNEARREVTLNGGGTIRRLKRQPATAASA